MMIYGNLNQQINRPPYSLTVHSLSARIVTILFCITGKPSVLVDIHATICVTNISWAIGQYGKVAKKRRVCLQEGCKPGCSAKKEIWNKT